MSRRRPGGGGDTFRRVLPATVNAAIAADGASPRDAKIPPKPGSPAGLARGGAGIWRVRRITDRCGTRSLRAALKWRGWVDR